MVSDLIKSYKQKIGLFGNIEYTTSKGKIINAIGKIISVSDDGMILVQHLKKPKVSWRFHISKVISEFYDDVKEDVFKDG